MPFASRRNLFPAFAFIFALAALVASFVAIDTPRQEADLGYLDKAVAAANLPAVKPEAKITVTPPATPEPAKAPRAVGVSNGSYDTKVDGTDFVLATPASFAKAFGLRFGPGRVTSGGETLTGGTNGEYDVANGGFEAQRGVVAERYMYDANRVEQLFVIPTKPEPVGPIEVASPIAMTPAANVEVIGYGWHEPKFEKGGLRFTDANGDEVASIYGARAVDAEGRQQDLTLGWDNGVMTMTVPVAFVEIATFPLTVDPWIELAASGTAGIPYAPPFFASGLSLAYSSSGIPITAGTATTAHIRVRAFNSSTGTWSELGGGPVFVSPFFQGQNDLTCPDTLNPIVVWTQADAGGDDEIYLAQWNGVAWVGLGGSLGLGGLSVTAASSTQPTVALDPAGNPIVAWLEVSGGAPEVYVRRFNPATATWDPLGASDVGTGISGSAGVLSDVPDIAVDPLGRPVVAWLEASGAPDSIYLRRFNPVTVTWDEIAGSASTDGLSDSVDVTHEPSLVIDSAGEPMVAYRRNVGGGAGEIYLRHYDSLAAAWTGIGGSDAGSGISADPLVLSVIPSLGIDDSGTPTVAWASGASGARDMFVKRFNGLTWVELEGSASGFGISPPLGEGINPKIAIRPDGYPGVAWVDDVGPGTPTPRFRQYDGIPVPTTPSQRQVAFPFTPIAPGGTSATGSILLRAVIPAGIPTTARLQVEIQPDPLPFTGIPTAESALLPAGTVASIVVPLIPGAYNWQYRVQAADPTINSLFTAFPGGPPDFNIGTTPTAPLAADLTQHHLDTGVAILEGGTTLSGGVIFRYTPSVVATEALRLQIDFTGDGVADVESPLTPPSTTISIPVPLAIASYDWTARLANAAGVQSLSAAFDPAPPGGTPDFSVIAAPPPPVPADPTLFTQATTFGAVIPSGGLTVEPMVVLGATITGAAGQLIRLQFDVEIGATDGIPDFESPLILMTGAPIAVTYTVPAGDGSYNWAVRAQSSALVNSVSGFLAIAGSPDFIVDTPSAGPPPAAPTALGQFMLDGLTVIPGGGVTPEGGAKFRATLPFSPDLLRLQVEVVTAGGPFTFVPDMETPLVAGGSVVEITFPLGTGGWRWQARTFSSSSLASAFVDFTPPAGFAADLTVSGGGAVPPSAPVTLAQENLDGSAIASGGTAASDTVVFEVTVPGLVTELNRIQVDVETVAFGLDGIPDVESPLVTGGTIVQMSVPLASATYNWQARTVSSFGLFSGFTAFAGGPPDFVVSAGGGGTPPTAPVTLAQENPDGTAIASGATAAGSVVVFEVVVPGAAIDLNRIQVDFETGAPDGQPDVESPLVAGGTTIQISVPFAAGSYNWQARAQSSTGLNSGYTVFAGGPPDFFVAIGGAIPTPPVTLVQERLDGSAIGSGATTFESTVVFEVVVPGVATDLHRIQIDFETGLLDAIPDVESALVAGGSTVNVAVPLADGAYNWAARTMNAGGGVSGFTVFAGGPPDFVVAAGAGGATPGAPVTLVQRNLDGSVILSGATAAGNTVVFEVVVPGAAADLNRIQISHATGAPDLTAEVESPLVSGGSTVQIQSQFGIGSYNWQAQTQSSLGANSGYTAFAGGAPDFVIATGGVPPSPPVTIAQENPDGSAIASGGTATGSIVVFEVLVPGAATDLNRVQVDVEAGAVDGVPDVESPLVPGGTTVGISVPLALGSYNWQVRTQSAGGAVSVYTAFAGGPPDFVVASAPPPVAPAPPVTLDQENLDESSVAPGGTIAGTVVTFEVVVPGLVTDLNRIQVSFALGAAHDLVPEVESPLVAGGSTIEIAVPLGNGAYDWAARTQSSAGANSGYTEFSAPLADFVVAAAGTPPTAPLVMSQEELDGTVIASGATTIQDVVVFEVTVPGAVTDLNRIQIDFEAGATDGIADVESALVNGGTIVQIAVPLANGSYNWAAQTMSAAGLTSGFTVFAGGPPDFVVASAPPPPVPGVPVTLAQENLDGTAIASGGTALSNVVVFEVVVPGVPADLNRIQITHSTGAPDATPELESPLVAGGSTVQIQSSFGNGSYNWEARTQSSQGINSAYTAFAGGPSDFVVAAGGPTPGVPAGLTQSNPDASAIASGGTAATNVVVFGASTPAGGLSRIQVEFATPGGLTGNPDIESPLVAGGTAVSISVPLGDGSYEWAVRTQSAAGAVSAYVLFAGGPTDFVVAAGSGGSIPGVPSGLVQRNLDGSLIPPAGAATGSTVVFEALVGTGGLGRIQVEFVPTAGAFSGVPDVDSPLVTAGSTVQIAVPHSPDTYEWQARTQSSMGAVSAFVEFAVGGATDYIVTSIAGGPAPLPPIALTQLRLDGVTGIPPGGTTTESFVTFRATLPGAIVDLNRLQVEYLPSIALVFTGNPSVESPLVPGGTTISIIVPIADGSWQWRARSQSSSTAISLWVDFDGPAPGLDFVVNTGGVPPPAPVGLAQQNADGSAIASGGTAVTDVVRFGASVTSAVPGEEVRLQVDFAAVGGLSGTPDIESPLVPSGSLVFIAISLGDGGYEWQARTKAASGSVSTYAPFGGSSGVTADFLVSAGAGGIAPSAPAALTQRRLDQTVVPAGGTTSGDTIIFEGAVSGPAGSFLRLEVEFVSFGSGLGAVPDVESPLVPTGSTVQIEVALGDGSYEWQARARTSSGAVSGYTPAFGTSGVSADFVVAAGSGGVPPATPTFIGQFRADGITAIAAGGLVADDKVLFRGTLPGAPATLVRLQVEYLDTLAVFTGNPTVESPLVPGSSTVSITVPIADGNYKWRARSQASTGASSAFIDFAVAVGTDFTVASSGLTPPIPTGLNQETLGGASIPAGGTTFSDTVVFRGTVTSAGGVGLVKLQVEFASPSSLSGVPDVESPLVPSGTSVTIAVPLGDGSYEWQARAVSPTGLASAFELFGGAPAGPTDFIVSAGTGGPTPAVPAGLTQLRLDSSSIIEGGTTSGDTVVFQGLVSGAPASLLRMQVEFTVVGSGFTGIPDVESALVPTGSTVQIAVPFGDASYEWRARTQSSLGAVSAYANFGLVVGGPDFVVASGTGGVPPGPPVALEQRTITGGLVPSGGIVSDDHIVFRATLPAGPLAVRLQVEFVLLPAVFGGTPSVESPLVPGGSVVSIVVPIADGSYGWRGRAQSSTGGSSGYVDFGTPIDTDFIIAAGGTPPPAPLALTQREPGGASIPAGGTTFQSDVVFGATVTGALPGDLVRLQIDYAAPGLLTGVPDVETPYVASGSIVSITVPLGDGSYEWQARVLGPGGASSAYAEFVAGLATDFIVDAGSGIAPGAPTLLDQERLDGTSVAVGGTIFDQTVVFVGTVSSTDGSLVALDVDFSPMTGVVDVTSPLVPSGTEVRIEVALGDGSYSWQARTRSSTSAVSAFLGFDPAAVDFIIDADQSTNAPATPTLLDQLDAAATSVPVAGTVFDDEITYTGTLPGLVTELFRLQVEFELVGGLFTGAPDIESPLVPGGSAVFITVPLGPANYHWRARSQRSVGVSSAYVEFGGNPTGLVDFTLVANPGGPTPPIPTGLDQRDENGNSIPEGDLNQEHEITFVGVVDGLPGELLRLQVEVQQIGVALTGSPNYESPVLPPASTGFINANLADGFYHWRARTVSTTGAISPWVSFGPGDGTADFGIEPKGNYDDNDDDNGSFTAKSRRRCGLIGLEVPALFFLLVLGRRLARRRRQD